MQAPPLPSPRRAAVQFLIRRLPAPIKLKHTVMLTLSVAKRKHLWLPLQTSALAVTRPEFEVRLGD